MRLVCDGCSPRAGPRAPRKPSAQWKTSSFLSLRMLFRLLAKLGGTRGSSELSEFASSAFQALRISLVKIMVHLEMKSLAGTLKTPKSEFSRPAGRFEA
jgi:hypothetical protein